MNAAIRSIEPTRRSVENAPAPRASASVEAAILAVDHARLGPE